MSWYFQVLKKYAVFSGRARRKEYWYFGLVNSIIIFGLILAENTSDAFVLTPLYGLAVLLPFIGVSVRRLHDTGLSGQRLFIGLIPLIGAIMLFINYVSDSQAGTNQYGPSPKAVSPPQPERKNEPKLEGQQPKFIRNECTGNKTYEIYKGMDAQSARAFLLTKRVDNALYYIVVETPEGNWGMDVKGLFLEHLLPWQMNTSSAGCEGHINGLSWSTTEALIAAKGFRDNFISTVQCGKCQHEWLDGVRYQNITVVRCPKCKTLNKVDSGHIHVISV